MTSEDLLYLGLLLSCILCGFLVRQIKDVRKKQLTCTLIGFSMLVILSGLHVIHPVILTAVNAAIVLKTNKRQCHVYSFIFCFSYLMFIRMSEYFGVPSPPEVVNTAIMIMVLKMVGLAYEVNIHYLRSVSQDSSDTLKEVYSRISLDFYNVCQYSFCYAGIFVGPYYKYRVYEDMLLKPYSMQVDHFYFLKRRLVVVPIYILFYLLSDYFFPLSLAYSEEIWNYPFVYRLLYMWPWFFSFRMRIYVAFVLGECVCISLGLGAYPTNCASQPGAGPTNVAAFAEMEKNPDSLRMVTYDFETVRSMDEYASEFRPTIREGIRYWNMTVQYWLAIYIYRKTSASKPVKMFATMLVSAVWHGVRPGYYLSLLGTPLLLLAEIEFERAFRKNLSESAQKVYDFFWYIIKMQSVSYMGVAFILLDMAAVLNYWNSIYYIGHIFIVCTFLIAFLKNKLMRKFTRRDRRMAELTESKSS